MAMANALPDPETIKSWEDAFQYPLVTTRQLERQLRSDASSNKERLRSLVGASYRDLLDTAERISYIDQEMQETETSLSKVGANCNSRILEAKLHDVRSVHSTQRSKEWQRQSQLGQFMLLQKCKTVVSKSLKARGPVLLAAKLLTISRLLHKTLSQDEMAADLADNFRKSIAALRRILLKRIDRLLASTKTSVDVLIGAICAFCLATSSSSTDAIKHFQHVRLENIRNSLQQKSSDHKNLEQATQCVIQTLRITRALLGRRLSDAFKVLGSQHLIENSDLKGLDELALDTYGSCFPDEVQHFTPYVKYTEMSKSQISTLCKTWSNQAFERLIDGLSAQLQDVQSIDETLELRRRILSIWLEKWSMIPSHDPSAILNTLRTTFNDRVGSLAKAESANVLDVPSQLEVLLSRDDLRPAGLSLWDEEFASSSVSSGASAFQDDLVRRHLGLSSEDLSLSASFQQWLSNVHASKASIAQIASTKWAHIIEDEQDDDSDFDEDDAGPLLTARGIERQLQTTDMELLLETHTNSLDGAITTLQERLQSISKALTVSNADALKEIDAAKSCIFLRAMRTMLQQISSISKSRLDDIQVLATTHHHRIADFIVEKVLQPFPAGRKNASMHHLWESATSHSDAGANANGAQPRRPLPTIPDPVMFKFLRSVIAEMSALGSDLWTASAVRILKSTMWSKLQTKGFDQALRQFPLDGQAIHVNGYKADPKADPSSEGNVRDSDGHDGDQPDLGNSQGQVNTSNDPQGVGDEKARILTIQLIFDFMFLQQAFTDRTAPKITFLNDLKAKADLSSSDLGTLENRSKEYWERSALLFGPLQQS